jgi:hypothetical protein
MLKSMLYSSPSFFKRFTFAITACRNKKQDPHESVVNVACWKRKNSSDLPLHEGIKYKGVLVWT